MPGRPNACFDYSDSLIWFWVILQSPSWNLNFPSCLPVRQTLIECLLFKTLCTMLWGIQTLLPLTTLPPEREDGIHTYKHRYRAKSRSLQESNMQVLKGKMNQIFKNKNMWGAEKLKGNPLKSPFKFSVMQVSPLNTFYLVCVWRGFRGGVQEVLTGYPVCSPQDGTIPFKS